MLRENNCETTIVIYDILFKNKGELFFFKQNRVYQQSCIKRTSKVHALRRKILLKIPKKGLNVRKNDEQRNWKVCGSKKNHGISVTLT